MCEKSSCIFYFLCGFVLSAVLCIFGHIFFFGTGKSDGKRIAEYARTSSTAQSLAERTEQGLKDMEGKIRDAGSAVEQSLTGLAELSEIGGRISATNEGITGATDGIEKSILTAMQILEQGKIKNKGSDKFCNSHDSSGGS